MAKRIIRPIGSMTFGADTSTSIDLAREFVLTRVFLELAGALNVTVAATIVNEAPQRLIRRIELLGDSRTLQVWEGGALYFFNYLFLGSLPNRQAPAGGVAVNNFGSFMALPLELTRSGLPRTTYLDTTQFRSLQLRVTWGNVNSLISAGTATVDPTTVQVTTEELMNRAEALGGPFNDLIVTRLTRVITTANTRERIALPREHQVRGILIRVAGSANEGRDLSNTLLNAFQIQERLTLTTIDVDFDRARSINQLDYSLAENFETPEAGQSVQGYVFVDFLKTGLSDLVDPRKFTEFDIIADVDAAVQLDIYPIQVKTLAA